MSTSQHPTRLRLCSSASAAAALTMQLNQSLRTLHATSTKRVWTIGRERANDIVLDSTAADCRGLISRNHATIQFRPCDALKHAWRDHHQEPTPCAWDRASVCGCRWRVVDLQSSNHTYLNRRRVTEAAAGVELHHADVICFAEKSVDHEVRVKDTCAVCCLPLTS
jgi:pSer/pThr/pTyr-binding forkhead associated (FHA) protein